MNTADLTIDLERRLLSSLTYDRADVQRAISFGLTAADFAPGTAHSDVFRAICRLSVACDEIDPVTVSRALAGLGGVLTIVLA